MNAHQLDADGVIINTIVVDSLTVFPNLIDASVGGTIGDTYDALAGTFTPPPAAAPTIPQSVTRRQAKQALLLQGLLANVQPAINAILDVQQRGLMQIEWDDSQEFVRSRQSLIQIGAAIGLDAAGLDALFVQAGGL